MPNLVPADTLAHRSGVKLLVYGPPGSAKTPICGSAPRPVLLSVENGTTSLRGQRFLVEHTREPAKIRDFFRWVRESKEASQFDTICIDSLTEIAEVFLSAELASRKDGRAAYGEMAKTVVGIVRELLELPTKHVYFIAKMDQKLMNAGGRRQAYFPGNELNIFVPHAVDEIYYVDRQILFGRPELNGAQVPTYPVLCWQTFTDPLTHARSRTGTVDAFEPCQPGLARLFDKIMNRSK